MSDDILEGTPDREPVVIRRNATVRKPRHIALYEAHPIKTFQEEAKGIMDGPSYSGEAGEMLEKIRVRKLRELDQKMVEQQLALEVEERELEIQRIRDERKVRNGAPIDQATPPQYNPSSESGRSFMNNPEIAKLAAGLPPEKQTAFFQAMANMEMMQKNPTQAMFNSLLSTYVGMSSRQAEGSDSMDVVLKVLDIQKRLRENVEQDPEFKSMKEKISTLETQAQQRYTQQSAPQESTGILAQFEKKIADKIASVSLEELFGGKKPGVGELPPPPGAKGTTLFYDDTTGHYLPKEVTYDQFVEISRIREERLKDIDKSEQQAANLKMVSDQVIQPLMQRAGPLIDALISKGAQAITAPPQQEPVVMQSQQQPVAVQQPTPTPTPAPERTMNPPEESKVQPEHIQCRCGNLIPVSPDARGIWPTIVHCQQCNEMHRLEPE